MSQDSEYIERKARDIRQHARQIINEHQDLPLLVWQQLVDIETAARQIESEVE